MSTLYEHIPCIKRMKYAHQELYIVGDIEAKVKERQTPSTVVETVVNIRIV